MDVRHAFRRLTATPLLSLGAMLTLALGIGSAVVMVDILDRLLLRAPAGVTEPDRVARVYLGHDTFQEGWSYSDLSILEGMADSLEAKAAYFPETLTLGRGERARQIDVVAHTPGYFAALGVKPLLGAWPESGHEDAAVIGYGVWRQEFGGSPDVLGKPLHLGLDTYTIVAVAPRGFAGISYTAAGVWLPFAPRARYKYGDQWKTMPFMVRMVARLRPGVNRGRASEQATALYHAASREPWARTGSMVFGDLRVARAPGAAIGTRVEVLIAGMSILVLLITCGNVANLLLVRGLRRDRELLVKTALGASRARLFREFLAEAVLVAAGAGILALGVVLAGTTVMQRLLLAPLTAMSAPIDGRVLIVTAAFCAIAAFLFGLAPAFRLTTRRALSPGHSAAVRPSRMLDLFSGFQVALTLPLIVGAGLFVLSLWHARHQDFGMDPEHVVVLSTNLFETGRPMENHEVHRAMQARTASLPGVEATAVVQDTPMRSTGFFTIDVPGKKRPDGPFSSEDLPIMNAVDPSFFSVMRMRLTRGRLFGDDENRKGAASVAVITEAMARTIWPGEEPIGKCFYLGSRETTPCTTVVGIVADARLFASIRPTTRWSSAYYIPIEQGATSTNRALLVRVAGDPATMIPALRREAQVAAPDLPYVDAHAFDEIFQNLMKPWRLGTTVFIAFGALSLIVAAFGLAAVTAYGVARRTREIGIRSALGARPSDLVRLVLARSLFVVAAGLTIGIGLAWASGRVLRAQLFDVAPENPYVLGIAAVLMLLVGSLAGWMPARRAARIDPVLALRAE
jgi:predicted permease